MRKGFLLSSLLVFSIVGCSTPIINTSQDFSDLEKEYKSYSTKALSDAYVQRMFYKYLTTSPNSTQVIRQLEFARYLKGNSDTSYFDSLRTIIANENSLYTKITNFTEVSEKMTTESGTFGDFVRSISPLPGTPVSTTASVITSSSFTANWNSVANATGYKLFVDGTEVYSGSNTTFSVTGLTAGNHTYYVKATNNAGTSGSSNTVSVTLTLATPATPTANAATNIVTTSFTANWTSVANVTGYKLIVDNGTPINTGLVTSYNVTGLLPETTHNYYVNAIGSDGSTTSTNSNTISVTLSTPVSCLDWKNKGAFSSGVYAVDQDNNTSTAKINVYCDMTTDGGGWTLVAAQYENDPILWNEGIQSDYDPTLATKKSFALNTSQLPGDRTQTGFGKDLLANDIDYADFVYTTGNISKTLLSGKKTSNSYHIHRSSNSYYYGHDPEEATGSDWPNTFTFDKTGPVQYEFTWAFSPERSSSVQRGYSYNGGYYETTAETFAWTVWVR